jgi:lactoylglutathione lyase
MKLRLTIALFASVAVFGAEPQRPPILGVAHISLFAHDYESSRAFYHEFLGFEEPYSLKNADGSPSMTFFKVNDRQYVELSPEKTAGSDRLNHYAIQTTDAEAMRQYLRARGIEVPDRAPKGRIGNLNFMIKDPEGHSVEIVQYAPDSRTVQENGKYMSDARISQRMMHVGIIVTDLDAETKFYTEVLGFKETWRGSSTGKVLSWTNLKVPDGDDYIEFMLYKDAPDADKRGSAHHLCLEVPDVKASIEKLSRTSYRTKYTRPIEAKTGINRKRQVNLFDPDGTRTELMEPRTVDGVPAPSSTAPPPGATH